MIKITDVLIIKAAFLLPTLFMNHSLLAEEYSDTKLLLEYISDTTIEVSLLNNSKESIYIPVVFSDEYYLKFQINGETEPKYLKGEIDRIDNDWDFVKLYPNMKISSEIQLDTWYQLVEGQCYRTSAIYYVLPDDQHELKDGIFSQKVELWHGKIVSNVLEVCL